MGLRMKNFIIFGIHRKMWFFREVYKKPIYRGGGRLPKRGGLGSWQIQRGLGKKEEGGVFEGGPQCTLCLSV